MADKDRSGTPRRPRAKKKKQTPAESLENLAEHELASESLGKPPMVEQVRRELAIARDAIAEKVEEVSDRAQSVVEDARDLAAAFIDASESYAIKMIELQYRAGGWIRRTPLKPLVEAQNALSRRMVQISARAARAAVRCRPRERTSRGAVA